MVGVAINTTIALIQVEEVGLMKTVSVVQKSEFTCRVAKVVLEKSGKVTPERTEFMFKSSGPIGVASTKLMADGAELVLSAAGRAELAGGTVQISGDPIDLN